LIPAPLTASFAVRMKLPSTRRHWNRFARVDPFWAVLTDPTKVGRRWEVEEFFKTGRDAIEVQVRAVREQLPQLGRRRALDFGCGVGRLSQALADHFDEVEGVDIAEDMLAHAQRHNRHGSRVTYHHNTRADLQFLPDNRFDFILSDITLQHVEPQYARAYIAEFVRVCAPGGAISFQLPSWIPPGDRPEKFKFSWYPPTLWTRIRRFTRRGWDRYFPSNPIMEVHAIPQEEVRQILESAGATVVAVEPNAAAGPAIESYRYLATKP
jgi:ubiquinone/menaquinone biosynthesis C-methylase UbiE